MKARIYQPSKSASQSGRGKTECWVVEYEAQAGKRPEPLMGWTQSGDTAEQLRLSFPTQVEAEAYARQKGLAYTVSPAHGRTLRPRNYTDNFRYIPPETGENSKNA